MTLDPVVIIDSIYYWPSYCDPIQPTVVVLLKGHWLLAWRPAVLLTQTEPGYWPLLLKGRTLLVNDQPVAMTAGLKPSWQTKGGPAVKKLANVSQKKPNPLKTLLLWLTTGESPNAMKNGQQWIVGWWPIVEKRAVMSMTINQLMDGFWLLMTNQAIGQWQY